MKTMANLPTSGQQYWGASLNNYIRSLESKITNIENNLSKKGLATAYLGSGWTDGDYKFSSSGSDELDKRSPGVYDLSSKRSFIIEGNENQSLIFFGQAQITTKTVKETIDFSGLNCIITTVNGGDVTYAFDGTVRIDDIEDGFFPIYICLDVGGAIKFGISCLVVDDDFKPGSFVYHEDFVLLGLIEKINGSYSFIKQTYTARKSLLDTRRDLLVPFATITNQDGLFKREGVTGSSTLKLYLESLTLDYQVGGIISSDNRDNAILDYKHFDSTGRRVFKKNSRWIELDPEDGPIDEVIDETASISGEICGIYVSISGDIFIDSLQGVTAEYANWSLNTTNEFKNAGLVLLGAYNETDFWYAKDNGLSPAFITTRELPTDSIINFPDVLLASSINRLDEVSLVPPEIYKLNIINDEIHNNYLRKLNLDLNYVHNSPDIILDYSILALPTSEDQSGAYKYWEILKGEEYNNFLGARLMSLTLNTNRTATIDGDLTVNKSLKVGKEATTKEILTVKGAARVDNSLIVGGGVSGKSLSVGKAGTLGFFTYSNQIGIYSPAFSIVMGNDGSEDLFSLRHGRSDGPTPIYITPSLTEIGVVDNSDNVYSTPKIEISKDSVKILGKLEEKESKGTGFIAQNNEISIYSPTFSIIMGESEPDEFNKVENRFGLRYKKSDGTISTPIKITPLLTEISVATDTAASKIKLAGNVNIDGNLTLSTLSLTPQNDKNKTKCTFLRGGDLSIDYDSIENNVSLDAEEFQSKGSVIISNGRLIVDDILVRMGGNEYYSLGRMAGVHPGANDES